MRAEKQNKSANYLRILQRLRCLRDCGLISVKEYSRAKKYYRHVTGADIVIAE